MTVDLCSELLARNLYYKRFFPYYTGAILCGIDEKGGPLRLLVFLCLEIVTDFCIWLDESMYFGYVVVLMSVQGSWKMREGEGRLLTLFFSGSGAVYSYDPIGCIERLQYSCSGAGEPLMQPFLDNQIGFMTLSEQADRPQLTIERAIALVKDAFKTVAERETSTGDKISVVVAEHNKPVKHITVQLRED